MSEKKKKFDLNAPGAKALMDEIVHGTFVRQGTMVAFPMCFPGVTVPIPADESHVTALAVAADGAIYGGTSGRAAHLFVAMFHGITGLVFDRGVIDGANQCAAVGCGKTKFVACLNGPGGGRVVASELQPLPYDLIQEWGFSRKPVEDVGTLGGERIVHAVVDDKSTTLVGVTAEHLFTVDIEGGKLEIVGQVPGRGRIARRLSAIRPRHAFGPAVQVLSSCLPGWDWQPTTHGRPRRPVPASAGTERLSSGCRRSGCPGGITTESRFHVACALLPNAALARMPDVAPGMPSECPAGHSPSARLA